MNTIKKKLFHYIIMLTDISLYYKFFLCILIITLYLNISLCSYIYAEESKTQILIENLINVLDTKKKTTNDTKKTTKSFILQKPVVKSPEIPKVKEPTVPFIQQTTIPNNIPEK